MEHSGLHARIAGETNVRQWTLQEGFTNPTQVNSSTKHGTNRTKGVFDWTGSYTIHGSNSSNMPGDTVAASFYKAPDAAGVLTNGDIFSGNIYIISIVTTWNLTTNEIISTVVNWGGNGALTISQGAQPADAGPPYLETPCATKFVTVVDPGAVETEIEHVTQAVLTITREAVTSVNSSTTAGGVCNTVRRATAAVDWNLALTTEDGNEVTSLATGNLVWLRAYVNATQFWELKWGRMGQRTGLVADAETGALISQTHNAEMAGFDDTGTTGNITQPGAGSAWWPA